MYTVSTIEHVDSKLRRIRCHHGVPLTFSGCLWFLNLQVAKDRCILIIVWYKTICPSCTNFLSRPEQWIIYAHLRLSLCLRCTYVVLLGRSWSFQSMSCLISRLFPHESSGCWRIFTLRLPQLWAALQARANHGAAPQEVWGQLQHAVRPVRQEVLPQGQTERPHVSETSFGADAFR